MKSTAVQIPSAQRCFLYFYSARSIGRYAESPFGNSSPVSAKPFFSSNLRPIWDQFFSPAGTIPPPWPGERRVPPMRVKRGLAAHRRKRELRRGLVDQSRGNLAGIKIQAHEQKHANEKENQKRNEILQSQHDQSPTAATCTARLVFLREVR